MEGHKRRRFSKEFNPEAVSLFHSSGKSIGQLAGDLDIGEGSLRRWVHQSKVDGGRGPAGALTSDELAELRHLRKEIKVLRMEREILKKALRPSSPRKSHEVCIHRCGEGALSAQAVVQGAAGDSERFLCLAVLSPLSRSTA